MAFADYCSRVQRRIEEYRIRVITRDVPGPLLGDLDGAEIHLDHALTDEQRLFLLAHLFGHTVQWNVNPRALDLGRLHRPPVSEELLPAIMEYEREATRYALALFHEAGISALDQWLSDYAACDMEYLRQYYRTGEKRDFHSFWRVRTPRITPLPVPPFTPVRRRLRGDGIVI